METCGGYVISILFVWFILFDDSDNGEKQAECHNSKSIRC